jgi:tRNA pseudouridine55 synthase
MIDETILVDKPKGMTSFGVVARIRRVLSEKAGKKVKVGHTGTLDPFATGLMIIVTGKECKNAEKYSKLDKVYEATIVLGKTSSTGDPEGEVSVVSDKAPDIKDIQLAVTKFTGEITQKPPIYSAIKIDGERAYKLAREGKIVDMPDRKIKVYSLDVLSYDYPQLIIRTNVSSGTYIRTLAQDIGEYLGVGAYCTELRRISIDKYSIENAHKLSDFGISD